MHYRKKKYEYFSIFGSDPGPPRERGLQGKRGEQGRMVQVVVQEYV